MLKIVVILSLLFQLGSMQDFSFTPSRTNNQPSSSGGLGGYNSEFFSSVTNKPSFNNLDDGSQSTPQCPPGEHYFARLDLWNVGGLCVLELQLDLFTDSIRYCYTTAANSDTPTCGSNSLNPNPSTQCGEGRKWSHRLRHCIVDLRSPAVPSLNN